MQSGDIKLLAFDGNVLRSKHGGVGGGLVTVGLHLHAAGNADEGLTARKIGHVDECVVKGSKDVAYPEAELLIFCIDNVTRDEVDG